MRVLNSGYLYISNKKIENIINQAHLNNIIKIIVITGKGKRSKKESKNEREGAARASGTAGREQMDKVYELA